MANLSAKIIEARQVYIPENARKVEVEGAAEFYLFEDAAGRPCVRGFKGRAQKPAYRYYFQTEARRTEWLDREIGLLTKTAEDKAARQAEARKPHSLKEGDIFSCSWGYDQTNVDFYIVVSVPSPNFVNVQQIAAPLVEENGFMQGSRMPDPSQKIGDAFRRRVDMGGGYPTLKISSYEFARLWDGKKQFVSWYA